MNDPQQTLPAHLADALAGRYRDRLDWTALGLRLGVDVDTAEDWVNQGLRALRQGGRHDRLAD